MKDRSEAKKSLEAEPHNSSLLGIEWNVDNDILDFCRGSDKDVSHKVTQRNMFPFVASMFDPLRLFAPFTMRFRVPMQTVWVKSGQQWLEKVTGKKKGKFQD